MTNSNWPPFDLDRLTPEERELWDEYIEPNDHSKDGEKFYVAVYGFVQICILELGTVPEVAHEHLDNGRIAEQLTQYQTNMREKRRRELAAERENEEGEGPGST